MQDKYIARGVVYGKLWGGGEGAYHARTVKSDNRDELMKELEKGISDGSLDSGMGYEKVLGALMSIETIKTVVVDDEIYQRSDFDEVALGELTDEQLDFCAGCEF